MHTERRNYFYVFILSLIPIAVSLLFLRNQSLRLDESQSLWQTSHDPVRLLQLVAQDVHVPLYHFILHFWQLVFGTSVHSVRLLSLGFEVLTVPAVYFLAMASFNDRKIALYATFLTAISPFLNWYGNEVRMYSMLTFVSVVSQLYFVKLLKKPSSGVWWCYVLISLLGIYVHYFFFLVLLTQGLFFLFARRRFAPRTGIKLFFIVILVVAAILPWLYFVVTQGSASNTAPLLIRPSTVNLFNTFSEFLFGFQDEKINTLLVSLWPLTVLAALLAIQRERRLPTEASFILVSALLPIIFAFGFSLTVRPFYVSRYLIVALPAMYLYISWLFSGFQPKVATAVRIIFALAVLTTLAIQVASAATPVKEDYEGASKYLTRQVGPRDVIILSAPFTIYPFEYYYNGTAALTTLPVWDRIANGGIPPFVETDLPAEAKTVQGTREKAYLLLSYDQGYQQKLRIYYDTHYERLSDKQFSPGLHLYVYKMRYDN